MQECVYQLVAAEWIWLEFRLIKIFALHVPCTDGLKNFVRVWNDKHKLITLLFLRKTELNY